MSDHLRIVSLIASATEIVCALGLRKSLVGRSHECDFPPDVKALPQCTAPKFRLDGTSYEIDQRVKALVVEALSVYRVDAAKIEELKPTHIITQDQCEVCAVSINDVEDAICALTSTCPVVVSLKPDSLADIWNDIMRVGTACGVAQKAEELVRSLQESMQMIAKRASEKGKQPKVAYIEWIDPLMAGGNWMPELIELAGAISLFGESGKHSPWMTWEELVASQPDLIVVAPCGFDIARTMSEMNLLIDNPQWADLRAVQDGKVFVADGNQYFNRPGPRVVESLQIFAEIIHPQLFDFGLYGLGWIKLDDALSGSPR